MWEFFVMEGGYYKKQNSNYEQQIANFFISHENRFAEENRCTAKEAYQ